MFSQTKKQTAYLASLTLLFSYVEMILPRTVPFFRLGLANTAILMSFNLPLSQFALLLLLKTVASSLMAGTLLSPFFLISFAQSIFSGFLMYGMSSINKKSDERFFSVYGISVLGSAFSAIVQIFLCSLYLGQGTFVLLGPMLIFNTISGIITAFFCKKLGIKEIIISNDFDETNSTPQKSPALQIFFAITILCTTASLFFITNIYILALAFILSLVAQKFCKRKILILPHIFLWVFVMFSTIIVPEGRILFRVLNCSVTEGALFFGIQKSLRLSAVSALSQCAILLQAPKNSLLSLTLLYYKKLSDNFRNAKGNIFQKTKIAILKMSEL